MPDTTPQPEKRSYKKTLNLPKTAFPMKANLVQNEPASQKRWDKLGVYAKLRERAQRGESPAGPFVFHDGPPYANGDIHLGHLLNKCLKDFVVRSRSMLGYDCPYTPGWDCHGLPIEHKVMQEMQGAKGPRDQGAKQDKPADHKDSHSAPDPLKIRKACAKYANKYVKTQSQQMQRLLTMADYDNPYLTMAPKYEAGVLEVFAGLIEKGVVYRDLKPVHWSIDNQTALAEAELEYYDREDTSVFVRFPVGGWSVTKKNDTPETAQQLCDADLLIWTTTPWTLPANLAVAVAPRAEYGVYPTPSRPVIVACDLASKVLTTAGLEVTDPTLVVSGDQLVSMIPGYDHPFMPFLKDDKSRKVYTAEYVTLEDGTGIVHTAPGHGTEDYQTGLREGLEVYCPVRADGTYDDTVPDWLRGESIWKANDAVVEHLRESGHLFHDQKFTHSYPHDWRGKKPVIFRATEQWFVGVDQPFSRRSQIDAPDTSMRNAALQATADQVNFLPDWGRNRMRGMLESRPDWCISRQRAWGLPIPAFFNENNEPLLTTASVRAVREVFAERGSDSWFYLEPHQLLCAYAPDSDPHAPNWIKSAWTGRLSDQSDPQSVLNVSQGHDTFDVWFESGSSWNAVLRKGWRDQQAGDAYPADLYLEGSDQHRGWFQHSLLPALAVTGQSPFKTVLTHGFMVDKDGRKMSKSGGNALTIEALFKDYGADVCRWWVASLNPDNDIKVDMSFFKLAGEEYRKVRNTLRFLLSNLDDFDPANETHRHHFTQDDATSIDAWALGELAKLVRTVRAAFEGYQFRKATEAIFHFCNDTMSAVYLAAVKDRLYCDTPDSPRRRRSQTACYQIASALCELLATVIPHTADEAWRALPGHGNDACIHLETLPGTDDPAELPVDPRWPLVMAARERWLRAIESFRQQSGIDNPLDLGLAVVGQLELGEGGADLSGFAHEDLADLCRISRLSRGAESLVVQDLTPEPRCERSWKRDGTVKPRHDPDYEDKVMLSDRDAAALGLS